MSGKSGIVEREIFIAASPETVFGFLVDPKLMAQWIGTLHTLEPRPGGVFKVEVSPGNVARGTYIAVTPPRRVAFTWGWESDDPSLALTPPGASLVEIELEPKDGGTLLRLRHSRLPDATSPIHRERWSLISTDCRQRRAIRGPRARPEAATPRSSKSTSPTTCRGALNANENFAADGHIQSFAA